MVWITRFGCGLGRVSLVRRRLTCISGDVLLLGRRYRWRRRLFILAFMLIVGSTRRLMVRPRVWTRICRLIGDIRLLSKIRMLRLVVVLVRSPLTGVSIISIMGSCRRRRWVWLLSDCWLTPPAGIMSCGPRCEWRSIA